MTGQLTERRSAKARNMTLFRRLADHEDGGVMSQDDNLIGVWMPGSIIEQ